MGRRVRILLPPGESRVRTCMLAELDQTGESQISVTDPDSRAMAAHTILRRRFDPPRVQQSYAARRFSRMTILDKRRQIQAQPEPPGRRSAANHLGARRSRRPGFGSGSGAGAQPRAGPVSLTVQTQQSSNGLGTGAGEHRFGDAARAAGVSKGAQRPVMVFRCCRPDAIAGCLRKATR